MLAKGNKMQPEENPNKVSRPISWTSSVPNLTQTGGPYSFPVELLAESCWNCMASEDSPFKTRVRQLFCYGSCPWYVPADGCPAPASCTRFLKQFFLLFTLSLKIRLSFTNPAFSHVQPLYPVINIFFFVLNKNAIFT